MRCNKNWKQGKIKKENYAKKKAEFRSLCECKKKRKKQEEKEEIRSAKNERKIWEFINKERKKKTSNNNKIKIETWREDFKNLLGGADEKIEGEKREMVDTEDDIIELTEEEIERQIKMLRKKEAPGEDPE